MKLNSAPAVRSSIVLGGQCFLDNQVSVNNAKCSWFSSNSVISESTLWTKDLALAQATRSRLLSPLSRKSQDDSSELLVKDVFKDWLGNDKVKELRSVILSIRSISSKEFSLELSLLFGLFLREIWPSWESYLFFLLSPHVCSAL